MIRQSETSDQQLAYREPIWNSMLIVDLAVLITMLSVAVWWFLHAWPGMSGGLVIWVGLLAVVAYKCCDLGRRWLIRVGVLIDRMSGEVTPRWGSFGR